MKVYSKLVRRIARAKKRSEELLRESEERFRLLASATNDAIWDWNLQNGEVWCGDAFLTLFGYEPGEFKDGCDRWWERIHPEDRQRIVDSRAEAVESGQISWSQEYRLRRADGTYAFVLDRACIVRNAKKQPVRMLGAMMDVTEREQLVEQLEQSRRVTSLGRVAASMAHEFNNVLMGIQPNAEIIQRKSAPELVQFTGNITRAVQRGKRITDEILRFTRPAEPTLRCIDVPTFLEAWRNDIRPVLGPLVEMSVELGEGDLYISGDPEQITQAFTNLAINARDAMRERGGKLTVRGEQAKSFEAFRFGVVKSADRFVHFTIRDEGCGISKDQLELIFEPLFTTKKGGIGLGLAVTHQVVTGHGGHIFVESELNRGSAFHVFLPATLPIVHAMDAQPPAALSVRRVLLVEDEVAVAIGLSSLMEMEGVVVEIVGTGAEAIPAIQRFSPDAVVLDIGLPDMSGVDVYRSIEQRWPDLPVLFSSGHGDSTKLESYLARPNVGFILKPYEFASMLECLGRLLKPHQQTR